MNNDRVLRAAEVVKVVNEIKSLNLKVVFDGLAVRIGERGILYLTNDKLPPDTLLPKVEFEIAQLQGVMEVIREKLIQHFQGCIEQILIGEM